MKHYLIKHFNGKTEVHFGSPFGGDDFALCGHDLAGDGGMKWEGAEETDKKVNCPHCVGLVKFCKSIDNKELAA